MFEAIKKLFTNEKAEQEVCDINISVAALLVHLAAIDGVVTDKEQQIIAQILAKQFELEKNEVEELIKQASEREKSAVDYYQFTANLSGLAEEERINIIRLMWKVVFADGYNHELEDNMVWRIAELIGVSSRERAILRKEMKAQANN